MANDRAGDFPGCDLRGLQAIVDRANDKYSVGFAGRPPPAEARYLALRNVLDLACAQAAVGKGHERHSNGKPFESQPIMEIGRMVGVGGHAFQVCKKAQEAVTMNSRGNRAAAKAELLGAIVYAAAAYLLIEEQEK